MSKSLWDAGIQKVIDDTKAQASKKVKIGQNEITIPSPFPSPEDWRDNWIYFLMVDRFNNPKSQPKNPPWDGKCGVFQGGTFEGIRVKLDYLKALGAKALWLTPVFKNCQKNDFTYHGYGYQDLIEVDPRFGTEAELKLLIDEAHARGMYMIFDIVLNHAGDVFGYHIDGKCYPEADWSNSEYAIKWRDENGNYQWSTIPENCHPDAAIWPKELQKNDYFRRKGKGGVLGGDFCSLKELITANNDVRNAYIRAYQYLIANFDIDGYRIDTLMYIERDFARTFGNAMREFALLIGKKNFFTFGEVWADDKTIAEFIGKESGNIDDMIGVDAALDFPLFFMFTNVVKGFSPPSDLRQFYTNRKQIYKNHLSSHGEVSRYFVTFFENHDQRARFYYSENGNYDDQFTMAVGLLFSLLGIPCLYYGSEQMLHGSGDSDQNVREALWGKPNAFDQTNPFFKAIKEISGVRTEQSALRYGRQYFREISGNGNDFGFSGDKGGVIALSRILSDSEILVVANTNVTKNWTGYVAIDSSLSSISSKWSILFSNKGEKATPSGNSINRPSGGVALNVSLKPMEIQILGK